MNRRGAHVGVVIGGILWSMQSQAVQRPCVVGTLVRILILVVADAFYISSSTRRHSGMEECRVANYVVVPIAHILRKKLRDAISCRNLCCWGLLTFVSGVAQRL